MAGKGDSPRPVHGPTFRQNWDKVFSPHREKPVDVLSTFVHICEQEAATQPNEVKATHEP